MSKIRMHMQLPEVELHTDTGHGEIEHIILDGEDYIGASAADFVMAAVGQRKFMDRMSELALREADAEPAYDEELSFDD